MEFPDLGDVPVADRRCESAANVTTLSLLVSGFLKSLLVAPRQPGLVLARQLGNSRPRRSVFLLDWRGGYGRFADGRRLVFLILLIAFLSHMGSTYVPSSVLQAACSRPGVAIASDFGSQRLGFGRLLVAHAIPPVLQPVEVEIHHRSGIERQHLAYQKPADNRNPERAAQFGSDTAT